MMAACGAVHPQKKWAKCDRPEHVQKRDLQHGTLDPRNEYRELKWVARQPAAVD
jgi:hypothetical protein